MEKNKVAVKITKCRNCGHAKLERIGTFGNQYVTNFSKIVDNNLPKCPLNLLWCVKCKLLQLEHTANFEELYRNYWYASGVNQMMQDDLRDVVKGVENRISLLNHDVVIDIGSNDSTLLKQYKNPYLERIGFEPAKNLMTLARSKNNLQTITIINNFFNYKSFADLYDRKAKVITACAMFYDLDNPNLFVSDMEKCLDDDGIIVIQLNYLYYMIDRIAFDNISHEHLEYYSLMSLKNIFERNGLEIFDIELNEVNGGSLRAYIAKKGKRKVDSIVEELLSKEKKLGINRIDIYKKFIKDSQNKIKEIRDFLLKAKKEKKTVYIYGASTRGNALLQECGIGKDLIKKAADRNPMKFGAYMVGSWIPIISEVEARLDKPDYFLVLPWQFISEMIVRESNYLKQGGKMVVFFPETKIY